MKPKEVRNQIEPAPLIATEVLDADAFDAFVEVGDPLDAATAERMHRYVYCRWQYD